MADIPIKKPQPQIRLGSKIYGNTKRGRLKPMQPLTQLSIDAT